VPSSEVHVRWHVESTVTPPGATGGDHSPPLVEWRWK
jgi:hypothetical protein